MKGTILSMLALGLFCGVANAKSLKNPDLPPTIFEEDALKIVLESDELKDILESPDLLGCRLKTVEFQELEGNYQKYRQFVKMTYKETKKHSCIVVMEIGFSASKEPKLVSSKYECVSALY